MKGSVPARTDVDGKDLDDCGKKGMKDLAEASKNGTLFGSHGARPRRAGGGEERGLRRRSPPHFNGEMDSKTAAAELAKAVEGAK